MHRDRLKLGVTEKRDLSGTGDRYIKIPFQSVSVIKKVKGLLGFYKDGKKNILMPL